MGVDGLEEAGRRVTSKESETSLMVFHFPIKLSTLISHVLCQKQHDTYPSLILTFHTYPFFGPGIIMAWAESPNTISYHPNISSEIILTPRTPTGWDSPNAHQESFVAGEVIEAVLHLETKAEEGLSIRRIEVECLAREGR